MTTRRAFVTLLFATMAVGEALGFIRGQRAESPAPPPPSPGPGAPDSPAMLEATGSLVGQVTVLFMKASFLQGYSNDPITDAPITSTVVRVSSSWDNAEAGTFTYSGNAGTTEQVTISGIAAGTWYVTAVSTNATGTSDISHVLTVVVT
jgi:hypothetical protein